MPRPPRTSVCAQPGCPTLVHGGGRCPAHGLPSNRASSAERGYGARWRKLRAAFLAANPTCKHCGAPATIADHVDGRGPLGPRGYDVTNLEPCCKRCHNRVTLKYDGAWGNPRKPRPSGRVA